MGHRRWSLAVIAEILVVAICTLYKKKVSTSNRHLEQQGACTRYQRRYVNVVPPNLSKQHLCQYYFCTLVLTSDRLARFQVKHSDLQ